MFKEIQTWARGISGTAGQLNEDLHAAFNVLGVAAGQIGERAIAYTGAPTASAAWQLLRAMGGGVAPSTLSVSSTDFGVGLSGTFDRVTNAARVIFNNNGRSTWSGYITGTDANLLGQAGVNGTGAFVVSIDDGAATNAVFSGGKYQLFSGQPQNRKKVVIWTGAAYANTCYVPSGGTVLEVTGTPPSIETIPNKVEPFDGNALSAWSAYPVAQLTNFVPANMPIPTTLTPATTAPGSAVPSLRVKTAATTLHVLTNARYVYVSVDGATRTRYDTGNATSTVRLYTIAGLSGASTIYNIWSGAISIASTTARLSVFSDAPFEDIGSKRRLDQYGDSITESSTVGVTSRGECDTMQTAAALGLVGSTYGIAGETVAGLAGRMANVVTAKTVDAADVAVIAIGRNTATNGVAYTAPQLADFETIITAARSKYSTVLVRGILPLNGITWAVPNSSLQSYIAGRGDANTKYVDVSTLTGVGMIDGTHPNDAGHATIAVFCTTAYAPLI